MVSSIALSTQAGLCYRCFISMLCSEIKDWGRFLLCLWEVFSCLALVEGRGKSG